MALICSDFSSSISRKRDWDDGNVDCPDTNGLGKLRALDDFRVTGTTQLPEEAERRGLSSSRPKMELTQRLSDDSDNGNQGALSTTKEEAEERKPEKIVTATNKGAAGLDRWLPDHIKTHYRVLQQGDDIYDATLNQTNVGENNNKFYVIQLLESVDGTTFLVYNRWGRVGVKGLDKLSGPYTSRDGAIKEFEQKFFAKTRNKWANRKIFVQYPKYYTWLEMDYSGNEESCVSEKSEAPMKSQTWETKLEPRVAEFISLVCDINMMKQRMLEMGYNANKLPLGKLSKSTILKGYDVLKRIADVIGQSNRKSLEQLSGEFYTVIPHDFGFNKMSDFVINTPQKLRRKLEVVEALAEIEVATKLLKDDIETEDDPLYSYYKRLQCELTPVEVGSEEYTMIAKYMRNTHARIHSNYSVDIIQLFRVSREGETERFSKYSSISNRMLLWHGSRLTNWTGILSQGLRVAPPEAPVSGYMFGKGVYFADMFSKSANYCCASTKAAEGVLLLCEVALGEMAELLYENYYADKLPEGKLSTKGVGATSSDPAGSLQLEDGVVVPLGKRKVKSVRKGVLLHNEYIVYNVDQIKMRYVVVVKFNFKSR